MKPHPSFADWTIPTDFLLSPFVLKALSIEDLDRDYEAVMHSAVDIRASNPTSEWPSEKMTREENMIDLAWHQREFEALRSFAWVIEDDAGDYSGCAYVYPSISAEKAADIAWWWRTGSSVDRQQFRRLFIDWLAGPDWPDLEYRLVEMG